MVSTDSEGARYQADLVRLICAEGLSDPKMFKERVIAASFAGSYIGRRQETWVGSYAQIPSKSVLDGLRSFTVEAMVMPTLLPQGTRSRLGTAASRYPCSAEDPEFQDQHVISRWDQSRQRGWALLIDAGGYAAFICGNGSATYRTMLKKPLVQDRWFILVASFDADTGTVAIHAQHAGSRGICESSEVLAEKSKVPSASLSQEGPLRFGACCGGQVANGEGYKPGSNFNGRLDRLRLSAGVLNFQQALALADNTLPKSPAVPIVGFWDFAKGIGSREVHDLSANGLDGVVVNMPMRAVAGVGSDGTTLDWRQRPEHYSAIHFHDDDLYDAEWQRDFTFTVPQDLPSGIYAARLRLGEFVDYLPFFVAPPRGTATAPIAVLLPTASYTAYTNVTAFASECDYFSGIRLDAADARFLLDHLRTLGKGIYANHTDGTLFGFASQKHPNLTIRPKGIQWTLAADSLLIDWLDEKGLGCDIITDELLHAEGVDLLRRYRLVITGNHPEYFSKAMLDAIEAYPGTGGRLMYLGGNVFYWVTSFSDHWPGAIEARKEYYAGYWRRFELNHAFDGIQGGEWPENGRPAHAFSGVGYNKPAGAGCSFGPGAPFKRLPDSYHPRVSFIFAGVQQEVFGDFGVLGGGAAGYEFDMPAGAAASARVYSLVESAKANSVEPHAYLSHLFHRTPEGHPRRSLLSPSGPGTSRSLPQTLSSSRRLAIYSETHVVMASSATRP
jgi:N,N-dimethylformamidase